MQSITHWYIYLPSKNALARSCKKRSFFLAPLQDLAGSCGILQESCRILARNSCKNPARFLQNPSRSRKIPQDLARSCKILQGCKKKGPFLARSCKSVFTGLPQNYTLNGTPLDNVQDMRDLGVTIDSKLNFHSHSTYIVSKANRLLGLTRKSFENISIQTLPMLYKSLVRPTLEYGNPIWGPEYVLDQQAVERVQRRATRMIQLLWDLPYHARLHQLNLPSLTYRRRRGDSYDYNLSNNSPSTQHSFSRLLHSFIVY